MATSIAPLTTLPAWQALEAHYPKVQALHLRKLVSLYERETGATCQLKHDSSTNALIWRNGRSKELMHG